MTDALWNAQNAVYAVLIAANVAGGRVYDEVSPEVTFPYVEIGETTANPDDASLTIGTEEFLTLHIWSRERGYMEIKQITDAIHAALHGVTLSVAGRSSAYVWMTGTQVFKDPDGITRHGVVRLRILSHT